MLARWACGFGSRRGKLWRWAWQNVEMGVVGHGREWNWVWQDIEVDVVVLGCEGSLAACKNFNLLLYR